MEIIYCDKCGNRIPDAEFERGAVQSEEGNFCAACAPQMAPVAARTARRSPASTRRSPPRTDTGRHRAAKKTRDSGTIRRSSGRGEAVRRERAPSPRGWRRESGSHRAVGAGGGGGARGGPSTLVIAGVALAIGFALTAGAMFMMGGDKKPRRRRTSTPAPKEAKPKLDPTPQVKPTPEPEKKEDDPRSLFGLRALQTTNVPRPEPEPARTVKAAPRLPNSYQPYFLNREEMYLGKEQLACKKGEAWLLKPEGDPPKPVLRAPKVAKAPVIDGVLDDECWKTAGLAKGFVAAEIKVQDGSDNPPAPEKTEMRFCYDDKFLYVAVKAYDDDITGLVRNGTATSSSLWQDDGVELFLDFNRDYQTYRQVIANVDGAHSEGTGRTGVPDTPGLEVKTKIYDKYWTLEIIIPLAGVKARGTKKGIVWGANFIKNGYVMGDYYASTWAHLRNGSNHAPEEFGYLIFE